MLAPDLLLAEETSAVTIQDEWTVVDDEESEEETSVNADDAAVTNDDLMLLANVNPSLGIAITNSDKVIETVQGGATAYSDHLVTLTGEEVTSYTLSISSSSSNLTKPNSSTTGANITGAAGASGNSMPANRWGYAVTEESTANTSYGVLNYSTMPTSATTIASGNAASNGILSAKKKVVIAARFGEDAASGTYRQDITLSAVATATLVTYTINFNSNGGGTAPTALTQESREDSVAFTLPGQGSMGKSGYRLIGWSTSPTATSGSAVGSSYTAYRTNPQVTLYAVWREFGIWSNGTNANIKNMQDINASFCSSSIPAGSTIFLKDNRGTNPADYKIIKMLDGTCWMAENLRLVNTTITSADSDVISNFTIPASSISGFASGSNNFISPRAYYGNDTTYGAYYNWYTATAGTGTTSVATNTDASSSICPRGWQLPAYSGTRSFYNIINGNGATNTGYKSDWTTINGKNGYILGYNSDDAFWPAAGNINENSIGGLGTYGYYWTRRASSADRAYYLYIYSSDANPQYSSSLVIRYRGYPIRCVAKQ